MFYKYESTLDNDLIFWSNATADLRHNGEIGEDDLPDELLHALNELWTDGHLVSCYLVELKGRYGSHWNLFTIETLLNRSASHMGSL